MQVALSRSKAKEGFYLSDADLTAIDAARGAGGGGAGLDAAAVASKKALQAWVDKNCGWTTNERLWFGFKRASDEQVRAVLVAAADVAKEIIDSKGSGLPAELAPKVADGSAAIDDLRFILGTGSDEQLRAIARKAFAVSERRGTGKVVHYSLADVQAACLRKYGSAAGLAAKLAANEQAAEKRAETMALKGTASFDGGWRQ